MSSSQDSLVTLLQAIAQHNLDSGNAGITPTIGAALGHPSIRGPFRGTTSGQRQSQSGDLLNSDGTLAEGGDDSLNQFNKFLSIAKANAPGPDNSMVGVPKMNAYDSQQYRTGNANTRGDLISMYSDNGHRHNPRGSQDWMELWKNEVARAALQTVGDEQPEPPKNVYAPLEPGQTYDPLLDIMAGGRGGEPPIIHRKTENPAHVIWEADNKSRAQKILEMGTNLSNTQGHDPKASMGQITAIGNIPGERDSDVSSYQSNIAKSTTKPIPIVGGIGGYGAGGLDAEGERKAVDMFNSSRRNASAQAYPLFAQYPKLFANTDPRAFEGTVTLEQAKHGVKPQNFLPELAGSQRQPQGDLIQPGDAGSLVGGLLSTVGVGPSGNDAPLSDKGLQTQSSMTDPQTPEEAIAMARRAGSRKSDAEIIKAFLNYNQQGQ